MVRDPEKTFFYRPQQKEKVPTVTVGMLKNTAHRRGRIVFSQEDPTTPGWSLVQFPYDDRGEIGQMCAKGRAMATIEAALQAPTRIVQNQLMDYGLNVTKVERVHLTQAQQRRIKRIARKIGFQTPDKTFFKR